MIIDLTKLICSNLYKLEINDEFIVDEETLKNTDIRKISPIKVNGFIYDNEEEYNLIINVKGTMTLSCARTLKDVLYPFDIEIDAEIGENSDNSLKIVQNRLDIFPIIWQNILADVPLRVLAPGAKEEVLKGEGWRLITEDDNKKVIDPRLQKLSDHIKE